MSAVEAYLQSRYHMYRNVYFHKVVRSAEGMLKLALQRAKATGGRSDRSSGRRGQPVQKALIGAGADDRGVHRTRMTFPCMHCFKLWGIRRTRHCAIVSRAALSTRVQDDGRVAIRS